MKLYGLGLVDVVPKAANCLHSGIENELQALEVLTNSDELARSTDWITNVHQWFLGDSPVSSGGW
jgi:hypothetical protein